MKVKDLIITSIIIAVISLATYYITIEAYTEGVVLYVIAFYTLIYVIVGIAREKRLERELDVLQGQFDTVYKNWEDLKDDVLKEKEYLNNKYANYIKENDKLKEIITQFEINKPMKILIKKDIPFATDNDTTTEQYICPKCNSSNVRETAHYVICNDCGKRKKKSTYGVKLTEKE